MPSNILSVVNRLRAAFPEVHFQESDHPYWSPRKQTVFYQPIDSADDASILLHEVAHAILGHRDFTSDIDLLKRENEAWQHAKTVLGPRFGLKINGDIAENHLETYRDWLHRRSRCPECSETGLQINEYSYECINCNCRWTVNDARNCQLRRRTTSLA